MIYETLPEGFNPQFEVVSCFVEQEGRILLLHRQDHKTEGNTWGVPAGKVEAHETLLEAIAREVREETGFTINNKISYYSKIFIKYPKYDFVYHIFHMAQNEKREAQLDYKEYKGFKWATPKDALKMNLIMDLDACIKMFYKL